MSEHDYPSDVEVLNESRARRAATMAVPTPSRTCSACGEALLFDGTTHHCRPDAVPVTLAMDAEGRVALTTKQAAMLARYFLSDDGADGNGLAVALDHAHNSPELTFARWVRRWAPVVVAAEALAENNLDGACRWCGADYVSEYVPGADGSEWACNHPSHCPIGKVEEAVRAARQSEAVPS